jgi:hypothetical protein
VSAASVTTRHAVHEAIAGTPERPDVMRTAALSYCTLYELQHVRFSDSSRNKKHKPPILRRVDEAETTVLSCFCVPLS